MAFFAGRYLRHRKLASVGVCLLVLGLAAPALISMDVCSAGHARWYSAAVLLYTLGAALKADRDAPGEVRR